MYDGENASSEKGNRIVPESEPQAHKALTLPYDPIESAMKSREHARRAILGILESYNSDYDALAESIQNSMDALEDACIHGLPGLICLMSPST